MGREKQQQAGSCNKNKQKRQSNKMNANNAKLNTKNTPREQREAPQRLGGSGASKQGSTGAPTSFGLRLGAGKKGSDLASWLASWLASLPSGELGGQMNGTFIVK